MDVIDQREQVSIIEANVGVMTSFEEMPGALVAAIEPHAVPGEHSQHYHAQRDDAYLDDEMEVISHQTIAEDFSARIVYDAMQSLQKRAPVLIIDEDRSSIDAACINMIYRARKMNPLSSSHTYYTIEPLKKLHREMSTRQA